MPRITVTTKGRITIPKEMRERLGLVAGDRLDFVELEKGLYKVVAVTRDVKHLKGLIPRPFRAASVDDMNLAVRRSATQK